MALPNRSGFRGPHLDRGLQELSFSLAIYRVEGGLEGLEGLEGLGFSRVSGVRFRSVPRLFRGPPTMTGLSWLGAFFGSLGLGFRV